MGNRNGDLCKFIIGWLHLSWGRWGWSNPLHDRKGLKDSRKIGRFGQEEVDGPFTCRESYQCRQWHLVSSVVILPRRFSSLMCRLNIDNEIVLPILTPGLSSFLHYFLFPEWMSPVESVGVTQEYGHIRRCFNPLIYIGRETWLTFFCTDIIGE